MDSKLPGGLILAVGFFLLAIVFVVFVVFFLFVVLVHGFVRLVVIVVFVLGYLYLPRLAPALSLGSLRSPSWKVALCFWAARRLSGGRPQAFCFEQVEC